MSTVIRKVTPTEQVETKVEKKKLSKKQKLTAILVPVLVVVIIGVLFLGLGLGGVFNQKAAIYSRNASTVGFYKYYMENGYVEGDYVKMTITYQEKDYELLIYMCKEQAPITTKNFMDYVNEGFYVGTAFHRIVKDTYTFQGGSYVYETLEGNNYSYTLKDGTHNPIVGEFANNKIDNKTPYAYNNISHFAGSISMARTTEKDSATSGFFFSWNDYPNWDGDYAAFGFIVNTDSIQDLKKIATEVELNSEQPTAPIVITEAEVVTK